MADTGLVLEVLQVIQVPLVIADHGLFVAVLWVPAEHDLRLIDADEAVFVGRFVDPLVQRGNPQAL